MCIRDRVEIAPAQVERNVVVAIAREPAQASVTVERVAAGGIRDDPEIRLATQVVDPGKRGVGARDHILASLVVEVSVAHRCFYPFDRLRMKSRQHTRPGRARRHKTDPMEGFAFFGGGRLLSSPEASQNPGARRRSSGCLLYTSPS